MTIKDNQDTFAKPTPDELDPYSWDQLADLEDKEFIGLYERINALMADKVKRCDSFMRAIKKPRASRKSKNAEG